MTVDLTALYFSVYVIQVPYYEYLAHILTLWHRHLNMKETIVAPTLIFIKKCAVKSAAENVTEKQVSIEPNCMV